MTERRSRFISQLLDDERLDALLVFGRSDMRYLCGFTGTDGVLLLSRSGADFLTDSRYQEQARQEVRADRIHCYKNKLEAVGEQLVAAGFQRIGFDARDLTVAQYDLLKRAPTLCHLEWTPLANQLETLRSIKEADELDLLRQAALLNRQAFETVLPHIRAGVSEREIALELEFCLKKLGGGGNAFDFIVASGTRGALPHGIASAKKIMDGELVTIDFGTRWNGYHSDETVTLAVGEVDGKLRQIFDIVLEAHDCAMAAVKPGLRACDLDAVARDLITAKGYGDFFGHGLGHGLGLQVHEYPALTTRNLDELLPGMVITIEPGIYLPGIGGVRIEDSIVVTADGYECLTSIPKQFRMLAS